MFVAWGEQPVVLQDRPQVADVFAATGRGEPVMGERYCTGGDSAEKLQDLQAAFPSQDALGITTTSALVGPSRNGGPKQRVATTRPGRADVYSVQSTVNRCLTGCSPSPDEPNPGGRARVGSAGP